MNIIKIVGKRISTKRKTKGLSQEKLAELSGLHKNYIGSIERGEKTASIITLQKISAALDISLTELLKGF